MFLDEINGKITVSDKEYNISSSSHSRERRGKSAMSRISGLTVGKIQSLIDRITPVSGKNAIIWRHQTEKNDFYKGVLLNFKGNNIIIITAILNKRNKKPNLFPKEENRFILE